MNNCRMQIQAWDGSAASCSCLPPGHPGRKRWASRQPATPCLNTGCVPVTNWDLSSAEATFGDAQPAAFLPHTCPVPHVAVVWVPPQQPGTRVVSIKLTQREGRQLMQLLPGGL